MIGEVNKISEEKIKVTVKKIICDITEIKEESLVDEANFIDDLGIESVMAVDIISAIEDKFNIEIPEDRFAEVDCLVSVVAIISEILTEN